MSLAPKQARGSVERTEDAETVPRTFSYLVSDTEVKNIHWSKNSLFNKYHWKIGHSYAED